MVQNQTSWARVSKTVKRNKHSCGTFTSHVTQRRVHQRVPFSPRPDSSSLSPFSHFPLTPVPTPVWPMSLPSVKLLIIPLSDHFLLIPWSTWLLCQYVFHMYLCLESLSSLGFVITYSLHNLLLCLPTLWLFFLDFPQMSISPFVAVNAIAQISFFDLFYLCTTFYLCRTFPKCSYMFGDAITNHS